MTRYVLHCLILAVALGSMVLCGCGRVPQDGVKAPEHGALFGAYVNPTTYTEQGRIAAFLEFESAVGRPLDVFHDFHKWRDKFPSRADRYFAERDSILLLSWAGTDVRDILSGRYDDMIRQRARDLKNLGYPVLLRWRWEMNRPNLLNQVRSASSYVAAWRHIHDIFQRERVTNVSWTWCPLASVKKDQDYGAYYPGDSYVDWICADVYPGYSSATFAQVVDGFMVWARQVHKPILIGEFGQRRAAGSAARSRWIRAAKNYVSKTPQIKAVCYFESDNGAGGAYDVSRDPASLAALRGWANSPYFETR